MQNPLQIGPSRPVVAGSRRHDRGGTTSTVRVHCSCREYNEEGPEISTRAPYQRDLCMVRYTAARARPVEFINLGPRRVARLHGYHRLAIALREDCEALGALKRERR